MHYIFFLNPRSHRMLNVLQLLFLVMVTKDHPRHRQPRSSKMCIPHNIDYYLQLAHRATVSTRSVSPNWARCVEHFGWSVLGWSSWRTLTRGRRCMTRRAKLCLNRAASIYLGNRRRCGHIYSRLVFVLMGIS